MARVVVCRLMSLERDAVNRQHHRETRTLSPVERVLAQVWAEVLDVDIDQIGPDADFLALGGDSLFAAQAVVQLNDHLGLDLEPGIFVETWTLTEAARLVEERLINDVERRANPRETDQHGG